MMLKGSAYKKIGVGSLAVVAALTCYEFVPRLPENWVPWGNIQLDQDPTWFARWQISRLDDNSALCFATLDRSKMEYSRLPDRTLREGCGVVARTEIMRSTIPYSRGFESPCALAAALYWYERRLHLLAEEHLQTRVSRIEHLGTYACRNINSRAEARRSAHATARAIDISGFRLETGTLVTVLGDWGKETPEGKFLKAARDEACRFLVRYCRRIITRRTPIISNLSLVVPVYAGSAKMTASRRESLAPENAKRALRRRIEPTQLLKFSAGVWNPKLRQS